MSASIYRRARRAKAQMKEHFIDMMLDEYLVNHNEAIKLCHKTFGEANFTRELRGTIHQYRMPEALVKAATICIEKGELNAA